MNKKLFILLPAALLALTGCQNSNGSSGAASGDESSDTGSGTSGGGDTSGTEVDPTDYGTAEDPLTVAEALAIAEEQCATQDTYTRQRVYVQGKVTDRPTSSQYGWGNFHLGEAGTPTSLLVWTVNKTDAVAELYQNDTVIVEGLIKNHQGTLEVTNTAQQQDYPTAVGRTIGISSITVNADEHATVSTVQPSLANGTTCQFTVTPDSGYVINKVKLNGDDLEGSAGSYSFKVTGDSIITVTTAEEGGLVEKLAYKLDGTITQANDSPYNSYAAISSVEQEGLSWDVLANTAQNPWRFGGKSITNEARDAKSKAVVSTQNISKVEVDLGDIFSGCTFNSLSVYVGTSVGAKDISELTVATPAQQTKVEFERPEGKDWSSKYFTVVFNVTVSGTSNKCVQMKAVNFYYMG